MSSDENLGETASEAGSVTDVGLITLSLISHTNVGKTTLARTLLRRDVGEAIDQAHVTDISEAYPMISTAEGDELRLWDTPGFGDTARLLKRLKSSERPIGWFVGQVWDRFTDRPLWCSQQAIKNVREDADIVLYLVNASEDPGDAGYVDMEMEILGWTNKPVVVLLNQTGRRESPVQEHREEQAWRTYLERHSVVKEVVTLDAFARCWVQENELFGLLGQYVPEDRKATYSRLGKAWNAKNEDVFERAMDGLAILLCESAADGRQISKSNLLQKMGINRRELNREIEEARDEMTTALARRFESSTNTLLTLHSLEGKAAEEIVDLANDSFGMPEQVSESLWGALGGIAAGATTGLAADLLSGGLSLGGGALAGGFSGGLGGFLLAKGYNLVSGADNRIRWSKSHFAEQLRRSILGYLAVAHFGRGRGEWIKGDPPEFWMTEVNEAIKKHSDVVEALWKSGGDPKTNQQALHDEARRVLRDCCLHVLRRLYPDATVVK